MPRNARPSVASSSHRYWPGNPPARPALSTSKHFTNASAAPGKRDPIGSGWNHSRLAPGFRFCQLEQAAICNSCAEPWVANTAVHSMQRGRNCGDMPSEHRPSGPPVSIRGVLLHNHQRVARKADFVLRTERVQIERVAESLLQIVQPGSYFRVPLIPQQRPYAKQIKDGTERVKSRPAASEEIPECLLCCFAIFV